MLGRDWCLYVHVRAGWSDLILNHTTCKLNSCGKTYQRSLAFVFCFPTLPTTPSPPPPQTAKYLCVLQETALRLTIKPLQPSTACLVQTPTSMQEKEGAGRQAAAPTHISVPSPSVAAPVAGLMEVEVSNQHLMGMLTMDGAALLLQLGMQVRCARVGGGHGWLFLLWQLGIRVRCARVGGGMGTRLRGGHGHTGGAVIAVGEGAQLLLVGGRQVGLLLCWSVPVVGMYGYVWLYGILVCMGMYSCMVSWYVWVCMVVWYLCSVPTF